MCPPCYILGLDLGQMSEFTALAVVEKAWPDAHEAEPRYAVRELKRFPLGSPYLEIVSVVREWSDRLPRANPFLVAVDQTGVGKPIVDLFRRHLAVNAVTITAGSGESYDEASGCWRVAKKQLVSIMQVLLQEKRLHIAKSLPEAQTLVQELRTFKAKTPASVNESFEDWRERDHDDLVFAVALACRSGQRYRHQEPQRLPTRIVVGNPYFCGLHCRMF
jgi:hypothetical protein